MTSSSGEGPDKEPQGRRMWPKVSTTTLSNQVYETIRDRIFSGDLPPGQFVRESQMAEAMGVSRTPVREALGRLAAEGLAEHLPRRGYRIPEEPLQSLVELYPIIASLEVLAARHSFPRLDASHLERLREINDDLKKAVDNGDAEKGIAANNRFHHTLSMPCGNDTLCAMLDDLRARVFRLELWSFAQVSHRDEAVDQHEEILEAIRSGDHQHALGVLEANRLQTYSALQEEVRLPGNH